MESSKEITAGLLKEMPKNEVLDFIRAKLKFPNEIIKQLRHVDEKLLEKEHRRFEMSGYESETGKCTVFNQSILNEFAYLGIYDYTCYLFLDFYKGTPTLYLRYFNGSGDLEYNFSGYSTSEIIYEIFKLTIFTGDPQRRRI